MTLEVLEQKLKKITGVDSASRGSTMIHRAVAERMRLLGMQQQDDYVEQALSSEHEFQALIDELMVTETWFFRDGEPFDYLSEYARLWLSKSSDEPLRIMSLPCATGEEPYSIAMVLMQNGLRRPQFQIEAVDISTRALRYAKRAVYGKHSFRGKDGDIQDRFFTRKKNGFSLKDTVRNAVTFFHSNFWQMTVPNPGYDIVFCRNLLIYFDNQTQQRAMEKLHRMLAPGGLLFVGHAETLCIQNKNFVSTRKSGAFAYQKFDPDAPLEDMQPLVSQRDPASDREAATPPAVAVQQIAASAELDDREHFELRRLTTSQTHKKTDRLKLNTDQAQRFALDQAQQLIDDGEIEEAAVICREHIKRYPDSAHAYYLLGLCFDCQNLANLSVKLWRKAVGLDPEHYQALTRLAARLETTGDLVSATIFREKARRLIFGKGEKKAVPEA